MHKLESSCGAGILVPAEEVTWPALQAVSTISVISWTLESGCRLSGDQDLATSHDRGK